MYDYRLFYPQMSIEDQSRDRRVLSRPSSLRVYRLPTQRRPNRSGRR